MNQTNASYVLVLEQSQIIGIFTDRDLIKAIASQINLRVATLSDVMIYNVITIEESALGMQTKSDGWKWIANYGKVVMRDKNAQPFHMIGIHRDISDRKRAEEALRRSETLFR